MMSDGRYRLRVSARNRTTGRRESATRTLPANTSLQEAQWQLQGLRQALVDGSLGQIPQSLSVSDYCEQWLKVKANRLRHNVAEQYVDRLVRHILPHLEHLPLASMHETRKRPNRRLDDPSSAASPPTQSIPAVSDEHPPVDPRRQLRIVS
jgi:hypothetical protein